MSGKVYIGMFYTAVLTILSVTVDITSCTRLFKQSMIGQSCVSQHHLGLVTSSVQCSTMCDQVPGCNSFNFHALTGACRGGFEVYTNSMDCSSSTSDWYYRAVDIVLGTPCSLSSDCPLQFTVCTAGSCECDLAISDPDPDGSQCILSSTYGNYCTTNGDCIDPNTECWGGKCKCTPGYSRDTSTSTCIETCTTYGNTYIKYVDWDLNCAGDYHSALDPGQCMDICNGLPTCLSMSYHNGLGDCQIRYCDPMTNPGDFVTLSPVDTYIRNCA